MFSVNSPTTNHREVDKKGNQTESATGSLTWLAINNHQFQYILLTCRPWWLENSPYSSYTKSIFVDVDTFKFGHHEKSLECIHWYPFQEVQLNIHLLNHDKAPPYSREQTMHNTQHLSPYLHPILQICGC